MSLFCDCETVALPDEQLDRVKPIFTAPGNYKKADSIAANLLEQEEEWRKKAALSALTGQIAIIGVHVSGVPFSDGQDPYTALVNYGGQEKQILEMFWSKFWVDSGRVIGWGIKSFDLLFMIQRSTILGVRVPADVFNGRYFSSRVVDLQENWNCFQYGKLAGSSLDNVSRAMGLGGKTSTGAEFANLWATDKKAAIDYNAMDCKLCVQIAERMGIQ